MAVIKNVQVGGSLRELDEVEITLFPFINISVVVVMGLPPP